MAGLKREARLRAYVPAIHVLARRKTWMPGIADKFTQSAQKQTAMAGHDELQAVVKDLI
jgi:hypothetical protein